MKRTILITLLTGLLLLSPAFTQEKELEETVSVVNIEVPVRVTLDGKPTAGLKKEDFLLYENGKLQKIHGFNEYSRKIEVGETLLEAGTTISYKPRLFVLVFNMTDFHLDMDKGIDFLFSKVLRKNDLLMVMANNTLIREHPITDLEKEKGMLKELVTKESIRSKQRLNTVVSDLETLMNTALEELAGLGEAPLSKRLQEMRRLFERVLQYVVYYKQNFLYPDIDKFYGFARYLEKRDLEKWVINFYQFELFPRMKFHSRAKRILNKTINDALSDTSNLAGYHASIARSLQRITTKLDIEMNVGSNFPVEEISRLFYQVNTTFHSVFMRSLHTRVSSDIEYKRFATDIENSLREITRLTGGDMITSNNLEKSLQQISEKEDIYYILTYVPGDEKAKKREIKVKMKDKKYTAVYDTLAFPDFFQAYLEKKELEMPTIKVKNLSFEKRRLSFEIGDFKMVKQEGKPTGKVQVHIKVVGGDGKAVFDQSKALLMKKSSNKISIAFNKLARGDYHVMVELKDLLTGETCSGNKKVSIL